MTQRQIARELQISRVTVNKYIEEYDLLQSQGLPQETTLSTYLSKKPVCNTGERPKVCLTQDIQQFIDNLLEQNNKHLQQGMRKQLLKKIDVFHMLQEQNYNIGYTTVCNYIRSKEVKTTTSEAFIRQEYQLGSVCEFDWGEIKLIIDGQTSKFQLAVFTSAYSNYRYAVIFNRQDTLAFMESHVLFFLHTKGVYHQMVYDNMRVAVAKFIGKHEKEPTAALINLKSHYKFSHRFCNARRGNEKGHVERSVEYVRRNAFAYKSEFSSLEEAQKQLEFALNRVNNTKQQLTGRTALDMFADEKAHLYQSELPLACADAVQLRVDKYATFSYLQNRYSVSDKLVGCFVDVKISSNKIEAYHENRLVASHERNYGRQQWIISLEHYLDTFKKKPGALISSTALCSNPYLKSLYHDHFTDQPRDFIELLQYCSNHRISQENLEETVKRLMSLSAINVTTEKLTALLGNKSYVTAKQFSTDTQTVVCSKNQLQQIAALMN
jgi:transposase